MTNEEIQESLKAVFRQGELQRRAGRRQIMLNHAEHDKEQLDPAVAAMDAEIYERNRKQQLDFEKEITPGYWQRLWAAVRGK